MPEESAYAHLGNAEQILLLLLCLQPGRGTVIVPRSDLEAVLARVSKAKAAIHRTAHTFKGE